MPGWLWIALPLAWLVLLFVTIHRKTPEWIAITCSLLLTLIYTAEPLHRLFKHEFDSLCLGLWFIAILIVALLELKTRTREAITSFAGWSKPMAALFVTVLVFAQYLYPHLKASWGGGTPVNVTLYFTKDSVLNPNKAVQAQLIEESDAGFYIVGLKESNAIFIPRNSVAMIYFSDKAAQSPMLQGIR
jgi:hypothetical protein